MTKALLSFLKGPGMDNKALSKNISAFSLAAFGLKKLIMFMLKFNTAQISYENHIKPQHYKEQTASVLNLVSLISYLSDIHLNIAHVMSLNVVGLLFVGHWLSCYKITHCLYDGLNALGIAHNRTEKLEADPSLFAACPDVEGICEM